MLRHRILTVTIVLPLFLATVFWFSQRAWGAVVLAVTLLAAFEWGRLAALDRAGRIVLALAVVAGCLLVALAHSVATALTLFSVGMIFWLVIVPSWLTGRFSATPVRLAVSGWLVLVCAWYALYVLKLNPQRLLALLAVVWIADTAAYFAGRRFGRRKLAPTISPGKTWEGVAGAVIAVGVYYALLWHAFAPSFLGDHWRVDLLLVAAVTVLSIEGDLFESWMKRRVGLKDSGAILPGHGGVLDRIDGLVAALPLAALAATALTY